MDQRLPSRQPHAASALRAQGGAPARARTLTALLSKRARPPAALGARTPRDMTARSEDPGTPPIQWAEDRPTDIARIANATARLLGIAM